MKKETLYLDTSVVSAYYDDKAKERQEATTRFWEEIIPLYQVCVSEITIEEICDTKEEAQRKKLKGLVGKFKVLEVNEKIKDLAETYVKEGVFPGKYLDDSLHVAVASFYEIPYLISWNFKQIGRAHV